MPMAVLSAGFMPFAYMGLDMVAQLRRRGRSFWVIHRRGWLVTGPLDAGAVDAGGKGGGEPVEKASPRAAGSRVVATTDAASARGMRRVRTPMCNCNWFLPGSSPNLRECLPAPRRKSDHAYRTADSAGTCV